MDFMSILVRSLLSLVILVRPNSSFTPVSYVTRDSRSHSFTAWGGGGGGGGGICFAHVSTFVYLSMRLDLPGIPQKSDQRLGVGMAWEHASAVLST